MRIGFISYEYAGVGGGGGIGTYVRHAARMMADHGHVVEVFCGADAGVLPFETGGVRINPIGGPRSNFADAVRNVFSARHKLVGFDVIEGPEFGADAACIHADHPDVALVVRLHTPSSVIEEINASYVSRFAKARFIAGALRRGRLPKLWWRNEGEATDQEHRHALSADRIAAPSQAIADLLTERWSLRAEKIDLVPNVFVPASELLALPVESESRTILFLGKLEVRKGVLELAKAIPMVVRAIPDAQFVFVGRDLPMPGTNLTVGQTMKHLHNEADSSVTYREAVPQTEVHDLFRQSTIAVFPSTWEAFGYVCLEAMAAGRAVVGSSAGGMAEIIEHGVTGLLVPPRDPSAIAQALIKLLRSSSLRTSLAKAGRRYVKETYAPTAVVEAQQLNYANAVRASKAQKDRDAGPGNNESGV